jgi:hypothetical protein
MLLRTVTESEAETYLIFIDRSRSDALEGPLGRFARDIVQKESFDRIKTLLEKAQLRLLVVGRTPTASEPPSSWLTVIRDRASIIGIGIVVLVILLLVVWRYRSRKSRALGRRGRTIEK